MKITMYLYTLVTLLVLDGIWLGLIAKPFYQKQIGHLMGPVNYLPAVLFYLIYALAIVTLVVHPSIKNSSSILQVFGFGLLLGLAAYGAYDFTNHATLKNWTWTMTLVDLAWGSLMTGAASAFVFWLVKK